MIARVGCRLMHKRQWRPEIAVMAMITFLLGEEMSEALAGRCRSVVATRAGARRHRIVIEHSRYPCRGRVAVVTGIRTLDVSRVLTRCRRTVVATDAGAEHLEVIDLRGRNERYCRMAVLANVRR